MRLQTILNRVEMFKSFTYDEAHFEEQAGGPALVVRVLPRKNSRPYCSGCLRRGRPYDHLKGRRFEFVPLWGILVFLAHRMRRVDCPRCGVTVEMVPWGDGKNRLTTTYRWYLASWARRLGWGEVGAIFRTSRDSACRAVEHAVEWGPAHRDLDGVSAVGIDEVAWQRGHTYMTLLYDIGAGSKRLLAVAEHRTEMKKVARTLRNHRPLIRNWFRANGEVSSSAVEGLNNKVKLVTRTSYGFRTAKVAKLALYHNLGRLPEPERTRGFC